jgi:acyl carrier protein
MDQANQLSEAEIKAKLRGFIRDNFLLGNDSKLQDTDSFMEKGIVDSTGILEVVSFVEENFGFKVADEELLPENLDSVNQLTAYIQKKTIGAA